MERTKSFDVWLAVKIRVELTKQEGCEAPWSGDAVARGASWLAGVLSDSADDAADITILAEPADLTEAAVRVLNQMGQERRHGKAEGCTCPANAEVDSRDGDRVASPMTAR